MSIFCRRLRTVTLTILAFTSFRSNRSSSRPSIVDQIRNAANRPLADRQHSVCRARTRLTIRTPRFFSDSTAGFILLAGGEVDYGGGNVQRLSDYWVLDLTSFSWKQIEAQVDCQLQSLFLQLSF